MPRLPETHHSTTASASAFHVKKNSAAMAPTWNAPIKREVIQLIGLVNVYQADQLDYLPFYGRIPRRCHRGAVFLYMESARTGSCAVVGLRESGHRDGLPPASHAP